MSQTLEHEVEDLKKKVEYYENLLAVLPGNVYWLNRDNVYLGCNQEQAVSCGIASPQEIVGKINADLLAHDENGFFSDNIDKINEEVMSSGNPVILEEFTFWHTGKQETYLSQKVPIKDKNNNVIGMIGVSINVTEKRQQEIENYFENIISLLPGHVYWKNKNGVYLGCNESQAKTVGFSSKYEMIGKTDFDLSWKEQASILRKIDNEVMESGQSRTAEEHVTLPDGSEAIFLSKKVPFYYKGDIVGVLGISFDITEQRRMERELTDTRQKLEGMTIVSASIAHELRTPLASLNFGLNTLESTLPGLFQGFQMAKSAGFPVMIIKKKQMELLEKKMTSMSKEVRASLLFIDMLLMNLSSKTDGANISNISVYHCINEALTRYPFAEGEAELVQWEKNKSQDFLIKGEDLLIIHVLFNLLKNAIYYITKARKGGIFIWTEPGEKEHKLYFKDTGTGISQEKLPHIFERFYSQTHHGAGVGLTFCKHAMESLGGSIVCESSEEEYTLFVLSFPV